VPRRDAVPPTLHRDALRLLGARGCPVCRDGVRAEERFLVAFAIELHGQAAMLEALRRSLGLCPAHTRAVLAHPLAHYIMRTVFEDVTAEAIVRMRDRHRRTKRPCPACESRGSLEAWATYVVVRTLGVSEVRGAYLDHGGLCLPHALAALSDAAGITAVTILQGLERQFLRLDAGELLGLLGGEDRDAATRHRLRPRLAAALPTAPPGNRQPATLSDVTERLRVAACPICLAGGTMADLYLRWLEEAFRDPHRAPAGLDLWLCPMHLHDLWILAPASAAHVAQVERDVALGAVRQAAAMLAELPPAGPVARARAAAKAIRLRWTNPAVGPRPPVLLPLLRRRRSMERDALAPLRAPPWCRACAAAAGAEARASARLRVALSDPRVVHRFSRSHGLCVHHALQLPAEVRSDLLFTLTETRLGLLSWELAEAGRKSSWSARYEPRGGEQTAWLRAAGHLDGHTFLGGPAVVPPSGGPG